MALTLEEAKVGYADKVEQNVIDEFRRSSILLDKLTFDDTISPTGGSNLVSVSNDGYSESYKITTVAEKESQLISIARGGLSGTGLAGAL